MFNIVIDRPLGAISICKSLVGWIAEPYNRSGYPSLGCIPSYLKINALFIIGNALSDRYAVPCAIPTMGRNRGTLPYFVA